MGIQWVWFTCTFCVICSAITSIVGQCFCSIKWFTSQKTSSFFKIRAPPKRIAFLGIFGFITNLLTFLQCFSIMWLDCLSSLIFCNRAEVLPFADWQQKLSLDLICSVSFCFRFFRNHRHTYIRFTCCCCGVGCCSGIGSFQLKDNI